MNKINITLNKYVCNKKRVKEKVHEKMKKKRHIGLYAVFASFILIFMGGFIYFNIPTSYVSVDINPSIMLSANLWDRVVKVEGLNKDAKEVISNLNLYGKDVSDAVNQIVNTATNLGYIDKNIDDNAILVSTYCDNTEKREQLQDRIHDNLNQSLNKNGIRSLIIDMELTEEDAKKANDYGVSEAKILFVNKALEGNPELKFEDLIYMPTREIAKYIEGYENITNGNKNNNGNGNQYGKKGNYQTEE